MPDQAATFRPAGRRAGLLWSPRRLAQRLSPVGRDPHRPAARIAHDRGVVPHRRRAASDRHRGPFPRVAPTSTLVLAPTEAQPPGWPGGSAYWTTGNKQGLGTATGAGLRKSGTRWPPAALSEVYYPRGDTADVRSLDFAVTDGTTFVDRESTDTVHTVRLADPRSLTYEQVNTAKSGRYRLTKTYVTDPARSHCADPGRLRATHAGIYHLYVRSTTPRWATPPSMTRPRAAAAAPTWPCWPATAGYRARWSLRPGSRHLQRLRRCQRRLDRSAARQYPDRDYATARDGNILQTGEFRSTRQAARRPSPSRSASAQSTAEAETTARASLAQPFNAQLTAYQAGWHDYLAGLNPVPAALTGRLATQYNVAVMTVKAHEDKTYPGAFIASLTLPWGFSVSADEGGGGYHFIWARDLYQQATAHAGRRGPAGGGPRGHLAVHPPAAGDGTFPQNSQVDGTPDQHNCSWTRWPSRSSWPRNWAAPTTRPGRASAKPQT